MTHYCNFISLLILILFGSGMAGSTQVLIYRYFNDVKKPRAHKLSNKLTEISGLAVSGDGRIFCHDDESGIVYQLNSKNAKIVKKFFLGKKKAKKGDFEGLSIVGNNFYLVTSDGRIFKFTEGKDDEGVAYTEINTWLDKNYDVEGLCYEPANNSLLLVCKGFAGDKFNLMRAIYAFSLDSLLLNKTPRLLLSIPEIINKTPSSISRKLGEFFLLLDPKNFSPSGIEIHPLTGNFFVLSSRSRMLIELDTNGQILGVVELKNSRHNQPEGITFLPDHTMLISDEGVDQKAKLTFYPLQDQ